MDTQNDGLEKVTPLKNGNFRYISIRLISGVLDVFVGNVRSVGPTCLSSETTILHFNFNHDWST